MLITESHTDVPTQAGGAMSKLNYYRGMCRNAPRECILAVALSCFG